jgi:hypothetical protein
MYDVEVPCMSGKVERIMHELVGFFVARRIYSPIRRSLPRNLFTLLFCSFITVSFFSALVGLV